jgi:cytochrome P450
MDILNTTIMLRLRLGKLYWLGDGWEFRRSVNKIWAFTEGFARKALEVAAANEKTDEEKKAGMLFSLATQCKDRKELSAQTLAIMFAGRDTTAALLGWCLVRLSLHPEIFQNLREAVLDDFGDVEQPSFAGLKSCRYLQHFLQEVLRLHPTVPINNRAAARDTTLPVGGSPDQQSPIAVKKGQIVVFSTFLMQRRKDLYGENALELKPKRWQQRIPAWYYIPCLGGPRACLGQQFALTEAGFLLVRFLQQYDAVEPADMEEMRKLRKGIGLTMCKWPSTSSRQEDANDV